MHPRGAKADDALEEVVVTAQKREEAVEKVPISITVLRGAQLDSSTAQGVADVLNTVPGVATLSSYQGGGTLVVIRGVSAGEALLNGAGTVAYYVDSVPFGLVKQAIAPDENAYDMQRIEVLRGPQGTLYGANALNGVVRVLTNDANLREFEFKARASGSATQATSSGNYRGDMAVNMPLIEDRLAARAVVGYDKEEGWIDSTFKQNFNDARLLNLRFKVNAQPTDALSIGLSFWRSRNAYGGPSIGETPRFNSSPVDQPIHNDYDTSGLKLAYQFSSFAISSSTSYLDYSSESNLDFTSFIPGTQLTTNLGSRVFSEEFVATSTSDGPWHWSVGDMYRRATEDLGQLIPEFAFGLHYLVESKSNAVFGEITRSLFDGALELTGGLRYFHDSITQDNQTGSNTPFVHADSTAAATTPRAVITWHPNGAWTAYASYSQGFRSGFPQNAPAAVLPVAEPDRLRNYELGTKGSLLDGRIKTDLAVYYMDWQRVQQNITVLVGGLPFAGTINGKSASGPGVDFAVTTEPLQKLILSASFSWNDLKMDSDVFSSGLLLYRKGGRLNLSPEYTASASIDYGFPLGSKGLQGAVSASANYVSNLDNQVLLATGISHGRGDPMLIPRASVSVSSKAGWTGTLYADNFSNYQDSPVPGYGGLTQYYGRVRPRTIGLQLEFKR